MNWKKTTSIVLCLGFGILAIELGLESGLSFFAAALVLLGTET